MNGHDSCSVLAGFGEADITPDWLTELVGFLRVDSMSRGVLCPLVSQVLVWAMGDKRFCTVTIDSIGFTKELANVLRDIISERIGSSRDEVMICFSHTHSAPNAGTDQKYYKYVCRRVLSAVDDALKDMVPIEAAWGSASANIGVNRRGKDDVVDDRIGMLKIKDSLTGAVKVLILRVAAHANVMTSDNYLLSPDYFGPTRDLIEHNYGCKVMMIQGAAGDIRPRYQQDNAEYLEIHSYEASLCEVDPDEKEKYFLQSREALSKMTSAINDAVAGVWDKLITRKIYKLGMFSDKYPFSAEVPDMDRAVEIADEAKREAGIDGTVWLDEVQRLLNVGIKSQQVEIEIQFFILNDGCLCGAPNETMCEIALDIQAGFPNNTVLFNGYTNGIDSYLPTSAEYEKGGYEVLWSNLIYFVYYRHVMPLDKDTAKHLTALVRDRVRNLLDL